MMLLLSIASVIKTLYISCFRSHATNTPSVLHNANCQTVDDSDDEDGGDCAAIAYATADAESVVPGSGPVNNMLKAAEAANSFDKF